MSEKELYKAMSEAFHEIEGAVKDKDNQFFKTKYADLGSVIDAIKPALKSRGLWFTQVIHSTPGYASVETIIMHESGASFSCGTTAVPVASKQIKNPDGVITVIPGDAQAFGSALTYGRRYSLSAAFGVAPEDDDANGACRPKEVTVKAENKPAQKPFEKLSHDEIAKFAVELAKTLLASTPGYTIPVGPLVDFLEDWQMKIKVPLMVSVKKYMENPADFVSGFHRWNDNRSEKTVELKSA